MWDNSKYGQLIQGDLVAVGRTVYEFVRWLPNEVVLYHSVQDQCVRLPDYRVSPIPIEDSKMWIDLGFERISPREFEWVSGDEKEKIEVFSVVPKHSIILVKTPYFTVSATIKYLHQLKRVVDISGCCKVIYYSFP